MTPDDRIALSDWLLAGIAAAGLHVILVFMLGASELAQIGEPRASADARSRLRIALGARAPVVDATPPSVPSARQAALPEPAPVITHAAPATRPTPAPSPAARTAATPRDEVPVLAEVHVAATPTGGTAGAPAADARPASAESRAFGEARSSYFDTLHARVRDALDYPRRARLDGVEGTVVLRVRIDREGRVEGSQVAESSGSRVLDRHAARIARRASPFGPVPAHFEKDDLEFELPLEFSLTD